jgi:tetratricopeptide (TPR) repeat protein
MKPSNRITWGASVVLILCLVTSGFALHHLDHMRKGATLQEVLYIPSPKVVKRLSLGYDGLLADVYWTRAVQYFGSKHFLGSQHYELLAPLLDITTALDPHLTVAYEFGANFLAPRPPNGAGMPQQAIQLVDYGIHNNPNEWKLYYNLGFIYYTELKDYPKAADAFARGSKVPDAHPFLRVMAAQMAQHAGELQMARMMWTTAYQSTQDRNIRANALSHLRALQVDEDVTNLEKLVSIYRERTSHLPLSFSDLQTAGMLRAIPVDPFGHPYKLAAGGRVEVRDPDEFPFIEKGTPPGYVAPPPKFLPSDMGAGS